MTRCAVALSSVISQSSTSIFPAPDDGFCALRSQPRITRFLAAAARGRPVSAGTLASDSGTAHKALTKPDLSAVEDRDLRRISITPLPPGPRALMKNQERESERGRGVRADAGSDIVTYSPVAFLLSAL